MPWATEMQVTPHPKVANAVIVGSCLTIVIWTIKQYWGVDIPGEVGAAATTLLSFFVSWLTPDPND